MEKQNAVNVTTRDRLLMAWEHSTELVRDFEIYSKEIHDDPKASKVFAEYAKDEGLHAAELLKMLQAYDTK